MSGMRKVLVHYILKIRAGESWSPMSLVNLTGTYGSLHLKNARQDELVQDILTYAREIIHIGEEQEGYFTSDQFCL